jgi:hypothetical protein
MNTDSEHRPAYERGALVTHSIKTSMPTHYSIFLHKKKTSVWVINYISDVQIKSHFQEILLFLLLALQPTVGFSLPSDSFPSRPFLT